MEGRSNKFTISTKTAYFKFVAYPMLRKRRKLLNARVSKPSRSTDESTLSSTIVDEKSISLEISSSALELSNLIPSTPPSPVSEIKEEVQGGNGVVTIENNENKEVSNGCNDMIIEGDIHKKSPDRMHRQECSLNRNEGN